ncbi:MAG: hypothetical protein ACYS1C_12520 [Planctomycetota bacterium]|jgi:hypothetical protein
MPVPLTDRRILRGLAARIAEIAHQPAQREKADLWRRLNDLEPVRPLVWVNEICWHEMDVDAELALRCIDPWAQEQEVGLRRILYQWEHLPGDMVVSDYLACPLAVRSTGFGLAVEEDVVVTDPASDIVSHRYHPQLRDPADLAKIRTPVVTHDEQATEERFERMAELYDGLMPVSERPEMAHESMERLSAAYLCELDQLEEINVLSLNADNTRVGSGAYGYTRDLPSDGFDGEHVRARDMWGSSADQMFGCVSPEMHWEFGIRYELRWLSRCGLTYYGCCEPLHDRFDVLRRIPNLRKVSVSPRADDAAAAEAIGTDYVFSCKPNPAVLAGKQWRPERARAGLRESLQKARGCRVEIVMKDISTARYQPQRLWEWTTIAMELAEEFAP